MNHVEYEEMLESVWRPAQKWCVENLKWVPDWRKAKLGSNALYTESTMAAELP